MCSISQDKVKKARRARVIVDSEDESNLSSSPGSQADPANHPSTSGSTHDETSSDEGTALDMFALLKHQRRAIICWSLAAERASPFADDCQEQQLIMIGSHRENTRSDEDHGFETMASCKHLCRVEVQVASDNAEQSILGPPSCSYTSGSCTIHVVLLGLTSCFQCHASSATIYRVQ